MITIKPDYSKNPKCYYCGKKLAVEGSEYKETMYSVTIQKHYECLFEPCNELITNTIRNGLFLSSNKIVTK